MAGTFSVTALVLVCNIVTGILCARYLGPDGRGQQAAMIMWPQLLGYALIFGLPSSVIYNLKKEPERKRELFGAALLLGAGVGCVAAAIGIAMMPVWLGDYPLRTIRFAQVCLLMTPVVTLALVLDNVLKAENDFRSYNRLRLLTVLVTVALLAGFVAAGEMRPETAAISYMLAGVPSFVFVLRRLLRAIRPAFANLRRSVRRLFGYGARSAGIDLMGTLSEKIDQALIVGFLAPHQMGLYVVALSLAKMLNIFQSSIVSVLFPKIAGRDRDTVVRTSLRMGRLSFLVSLAAALVLMVAGSPLLMLMYGSEYADSVHVYRLLVIEVVFSGTIWVIAQSFMSLGKPGTVTVQQAVGVGLNIPMLLVFIPMFGIAGAALSLLLSTLARLAFLVTACRRQLGVPLREMLSFRGDVAWLRSRLKAAGGIREEETAR